MWLLNARTRKLESFMDDREVRGKYAILSHTWENQEVLFGDIANLSEARKKAGYRKIRYTCKQAIEDRLEYVWVDTCCIDKTSSAELSEAINCMYNWYKHGAICYVYLSDTTEGQTDLSQCLRDCRWFTRGWTLQELLAPTRVRFFDQNWTYLLEKGPSASNESIQVLSTLTGIDGQILRHCERVQNASVAERLSWAASRATTRLEDQAYSLLGLLEINMPLLYGEGERAFIRLQEEVIKSRTQIDHSILVHDGRLVLATSPQDFRESKAIAIWSPPQRESLELLNIALRISVEISPIPDPHTAEYDVVLRCRLSSGNHRLGFKVRPRSHAASQNDGVFAAAIFDRTSPVLIFRRGAWLNFVRREILIARASSNDQQQASVFVELRVTGLTPYCGQELGYRSTEESENVFGLATQPVREQDYSQIKSWKGFRNLFNRIEKYANIEDVPMRVGSIELMSLKDSACRMDVFVYLIGSSRESFNQPGAIVVAKPSIPGTTCYGFRNFSEPGTLYEAAMKWSSLTKVQGEALRRRDTVQWVFRLSNVIESAHELIQSREQGRPERPTISELSWIWS